MALVLSPPSTLHPMTTSILLRSSPPTSPDPAPVPLPVSHSDHSASSSTSTRGSSFDLRRTSSARTAPRIRFAPLPDPHRDILDIVDPSFDHPQPNGQPTTQPPPASDDPRDGLVSLSPSISPDSSQSSTRSTPTIRVSPNMSARNSLRSNSRLLRPFAFFLRPSSANSSPILQTASLPSSRNPSVSSLHPSSSSVPASPSFQSAKLPRFCKEDILTFGTKSFFRGRSGSSTGSRPTRTSSPPPKHSNSTTYPHRSASVGPGPGNGQRDWRQGSTQSPDSSSTAGSGVKKRRASSSALTPGAGGGRHASSVKMAPNSPPRASSALGYVPPPKKHVRMLNGRIYGAKRYAAQTLANPFANVRDEPEFVEWGYGGMGSVDASAGIGNDMWKGLQRSERGGALLSGSSGLASGSTTRAFTAGGGRGSGAHATSSIPRRKMSDDVPECGMGNVSASNGPDDDDGSGMGWVKRRRAEREAARLEQEAKELEKNLQERRKSSDSIDASMYASTASTATSLTACTSGASTDLTTPLTSRSPSVTDLTLTSSPSLEFHVVPPCAESDEQCLPDTDTSSVTHPAGAPKDEHERHIFTAVRLSPNISASSHKHSHSLTHGHIPSSCSLSQLSGDANIRDTEQVVLLSPLDTGAVASSNSVGEEEEVQSRGSDEEEQDDDDDDEVQDIARRTALGAGVEKVSRHVNIEAR